MKKAWLLILCCHWVLGQKSDSPPSTMAMFLGFGSQSNVNCFGGSDGKASVTDLSSERIIIKSRFEKINSFFQNG